MQVSWLHVSDFHIRAGDPYDRDAVLKTLVKSVADYRKKGRSPDLIFATGDIAYSGKPAEYELATQFFNDLLAAARVEKRRLFVIPGNHDVDRDQGVGLARTLASREDSDKYFAPPAPKPHLTQKMSAFLNWHDEFFKGIRQWPRDTSCGPVELAEIRGSKLGILLINSALFCLDDDDYNKLMVGRRALEGSLEKLKALKANLNLALIHHPLDWLNDLERSNIKVHLLENVDFILRGHLHETEVEHVASAFGQSLFCAAGAAYQTRKWPNRAIYANLKGKQVAIFPIRYEDQPGEVWTVDPSLFPQEKNYEKSFVIPRLILTGSTPAPTAPVEPPTPQSLPKYRSNIPSRRGLPIIGREKDLEQILKVLDKPEQETVLVLHGHSGAGKSELAKEFARRHVGRYPGGTFLLDASTGALDIDFARIGKTLLGLNFPGDLSLPEQGQRTFYSLGSAPTLLIYDNLPAPRGISSWLPPAGMAVHVLITSVLDKWEGWQSREVEPLKHEESMHLIQELGGRDVAEKFGEQLASLAGGLPIQICPAAITLAHEQRRGRLNSAKISLAPQADESFHLVYDNLEHPVRLLLHSAILFSHQRIPRAELSAHMQKALGWSETDFEKHLDACFDLHLLEGSADLKMHQLFAGFLNNLPLEHAQAELLGKVRLSQAERFKELASEVAAHPNRTDLAANLITFPLSPQVWDEAGGPIATDDGERIGRALVEIGRFDEALTWYERAMAEKEKGNVHGVVDHANLGSSLHHVGYCLSNIGNYDEARAWFERAVAEKEKGDAHGVVDHANLGRSLHQVGACFSLTGKYEEARPWYERAMAEAEKGDVHGRVDHESLQRNLHAVGHCLSQTGKYEEARPWYERAAAEAEKGDMQGRVDHENLGRSLHSVGYCLSETGKYEQALPWYERAVAEAEKGDVHRRVDHASLGGSLHQVGYCLSDMGKYEQALPWYQRAAAEAEKGDVHGRVDHESLSGSLHQIGYTLSQAGKYEEARPLYERAAAEAGKGDEHGRVDHESQGRSLELVGFCLFQTENYEEARLWYERAVAAKRKGDVFRNIDRSSLALSLQSGAVCLRKLGKIEDADAWENEAKQLESNTNA